MSDLRDLIANRLENADRERAEIRVEKMRRKRKVDDLPEVVETQVFCNPQPQKLTPEQLENWRKFLTMQFGVFGRLFSNDEIQAYRDGLQNSLSENNKDGSK